MAELSPAAKTVISRAMEFSGPAFERLVRQIIGEAIRSAVAHTQQHRGNDVWTCDADELIAIAAELEAAEAKPSRRQIFPTPHQIAECCGPCEQGGPEACDCGLYERNASKSTHLEVGDE